MLLVILAICIIVYIVGLVLEDYDAGLIMAMCSITIGVIVLITVLVGSVTLVDAKYIDEKIALYQEENAVIEEQIDAAVKQYQEYEGSTLKELKPSSTTQLIILYPELKSDVLVKQQITTYTENNAKIKQLKEEKINYKPWKWWMYFGG